MLNQAVEQSGDQPALNVTRNGVWIRWTYKEYLEDVKIVARAFIKLNNSNDIGNGISKGRSIDLMHTGPTINSSFPR